MATDQQIIKEEVPVVVHRWTGTEREVMDRYHHDVDQMGWRGYVEVTHTITNRPRGWRVLIQPPQKEIVVTFRRLD